MARKRQATKRARAWNQPERKCSTCGDPIWPRSDGRPASAFCSYSCREAYRRLSTKPMRRPERTARKRSEDGPPGGARIGGAGGLPQ